MTNQAKIKEAHKLLAELYIKQRKSWSNEEWNACIDAIKRDPTGLCGATAQC